MNGAVPSGEQWRTGVATATITAHPSRERRNRSSAEGVRVRGRAGGRRAGSWRRATGIAAHLFSDRARPLRFALVGGLCGAVQLGLLALFLARGAPALPANGVAFLLSAQFNFALSTVFVWHDRRIAGQPARGLVNRWLAFHGSIAGTAVLNQLVFLLAYTRLPDLPASGLGIGVAALSNFLLQDRLIFRHGRGRPAEHEARRVLTKRRKPS